MKKSGILNGIGAALGILIMILDSKTALQGAQEGMDLCIRTVIPSLFPFFVLSILLTGILTGRDLTILRPLGRIAGIPAGAESILITGFLGGYPVGAQSIALAVKNGQLHKSDAMRMMGFCSNAGPSFLFGITVSLFPYPWMVWMLWIIHIVSALLVSLILPGRSSRKAASGKTVNVSLPSALNDALRVMSGVCGWIILFRIVIVFINRWVLWSLPVAVRVIISGILELTNGCCGLTSLNDLGLRFVICSGLLAFGGLCVTMQTISVSAGMGLGWYFPGKLLQTLISLVLASFVQMLIAPRQFSDLFFIVLLSVLLFSISFLIIHQKNSSIYEKHRV